MISLVESDIMSNTDFGLIQQIMNSLRIMSIDNRDSFATFGNLLGQEILGIEREIVDSDYMCNVFRKKRE